MQRFADWLARRPFLAVALVLLLSAGAAVTLVDPFTRALRLDIDASIDKLLPASSDDRAVDNRVREMFGDSEAILVAVTLRPVFSADNLKRVTAITERFRELAGVERVFSLASSPNLLASGDTVDVRTFTQLAIENPDHIKDFKRQLDANPIYRGTLVSTDGNVVAFALTLAGVDEDAVLKRDYPSQIRAIVKDVAGDAPVWITGSPIGRAATTTTLIATLKFTIPAVFAVILTLLLIAFRSVRAMLVAAVTVMLALLWTLASAVLLHIPMNLVTAIVPPLVITLGLSYTIYLLSAHFASLQEAALTEPRQRRAWTIERASVGLLLSAGTTVAGFLALLPNPLPAIRQFAVLASIGSVIGVLLALVFMPAVLSLLGTKGESRPPLENLFARMARAIAGFDLRWRYAIIGVAVVLIPVGLLFARKVQTGSEFIKSFKPEAVVRSDFENINSTFNGANLISILIETHVTDALTDPALVGEIENLQGWLRSQPEVGAVVSFVDHLRLINQSLSGAEPGDPVPDSATAIKQLLVFGGSEDLSRTIDARLRSALISIRINVDDSVPIENLVRRIEDRLAQLPPPLNGHVTGSPVLATHTVKAIASGQLESVLIATAIIWALLAFMFTSMRAGAIALLPTVVPVVIYFGTLGILGISLSPTTSLIACIVIGIAVDDTIQFMARFNIDAREKGSEREATTSALVSMLRPVTLSTVALCAGFLVFTGGELRSQAQFGALSAFTLAMAWLMNITLTPALGSLLRIVTLWDLLRLDLGKSPQHTIPLMAGLTLRQARVFALISRIETHEAGGRVIKEGDWARDMYVIVDGELTAWVDRDGERRELSTMGRGAVLGEAGFFGQRRTANVDAVSTARLLRFGSEELERLRSRYPRIAATVFRNLNRIQAERLARTTAMLQ